MWVGPRSFGLFVVDERGLLLCVGFDGLRLEEVRVIALFLGRDWQGGEDDAGVVLLIGLSGSQLYDLRVLVMMIGALVVVEVPPELLEDVSPALRSLALPVPRPQITQHPFLRPLDLADPPASHKLTKKINKIYNPKVPHLRCLTLIAIDLYVMSNIEHDLLHSQNQILALLKDYEKSSEDIIASNYTAQLVSVL